MDVGLPLKRVHDLFKIFLAGRIFIYQIIERLQIERVDWIKIDVEGAEFQVLKGLKKTLAKMRPKLIVEVLLKNLQYVKNFLKEHDYRITSIEGLRGKNVAGFDYDYIYCKPA